MLVTPKLRSSHMAAIQHLNLPEPMTQSCKFTGDVRFQRQNGLNPQCY